MNEYYNYSDIYESFSNTDTGACFMSKGRYKKNNEIVLDNDCEGHGRFGHLILQCKKDGIYIVKGQFLEAKENKKWMFNAYNSINDCVDDIAIFTRAYFSSFRATRVKNIKNLKQTNFV